MEAIALTEQRQAAQAEVSRSPRRGRFLLLLLLIIFICGFAIYRSPLFRLDAVVVIGGDRITAERVQEVAGLYPGVPRWERPAAKVVELLLQEPWVATAKARWDWNQLTVELTERRPVGLVRYHDRFYLSLDGSGVILEQVELTEGRGLPVVSGVSLTEAVRGQRLTHQGLADALTVLALMPERLRAQVSEVKVEEDHSLVLFMAEGATVRWGTLPAGAQERQASVTHKVGALELFWFDEAAKHGHSCLIDLRVEGPLIASGCQ